MPYQKQTSENDNRKNSIFISLLLIFVTASVYWQVQKFDFINYDDNDYIYNNPHVQDGITANTIAWAFTTAHASNWHPLTWMSHMLDCQMFGLWPGGHHLTSLFIHIANALLLFSLFRKMTGDLWQSAFVGALFALHPLHIQSVAWISERKDVLSGFFWMLTLLAYVRYVRRPGWIAYVGVLIFFILGLLSKPMVVTLPFVMLLLDYWPLNRIQLTGLENNLRLKAFFVLLREKIPLFLLAAASAGITFYVQQKGGAVQLFDVVPLVNRIYNIPISYIIYIIKTVFPYKLAAFYPYPNGFPWWEVIAAILTLLAGTVLAIRLTFRYPYIIVGWLFFIGTLVPVIGFVQVGVQSMADRYMYLPMIGLLIIVAWGIPDFISNWQSKRFWLGATAILAVIILSAATWKQTGYWKDSVSLFSHAIEVTENNFVAHANLGTALRKDGKNDQAIVHFRNSLAISPDQSDVYMALGLALDERGNPEKALACLEKSVLLDPEYYDAQYNLGTFLLKNGEWDQAISHLEKATCLNPGSDQAQFNLANAFFQKKQFQPALVHAQNAIDLNPEHEKAYLIAGSILFSQGNYQKALKYFNAILAFNPSSAEALQYSGTIFLKQKQIGNALAAFKNALILDPENKETLQLIQQIDAKLAAAEQAILRKIKNGPDNPGLHLQLGKIYQAQNLNTSAVEQFKLAITRHPKSIGIDALYSLAKLHADQGHYETAISFMKQAISFQPLKPSHYYNIACLYAQQDIPDKALAWLKKALDRGYANWNQIQTDEDLESIRNTKEFRKLIRTAD